MILPMARPSNPFFSEEMAEYLEENGFHKSKCHVSGTMFVKPDRAVIINGDKVSFRAYDTDEFSEFASFEGIDSLDINGWIMLLHITGIITIEEFRNNARRLNRPLPHVVQIAEHVYSKSNTDCYATTSTNGCGPGHHIDDHPLYEKNETNS